MIVSDLFQLNFTNQPHVSLFSLRWISPALTWASRNIIPMFTTRLTATCWTLKCNNYAILLLFGVIISGVFPGTQTAVAPSAPPPHALKASLPPLHHPPLKCHHCMSSPRGEKKLSEISNQFYNKGTKNSFKCFFVYSVFICPAAPMNWVLVWNWSLNCTRVVYLLCHSTRDGVLITTSFHVCLLHAGNVSVYCWKPQLMCVSKIVAVRANFVYHRCDECMLCFFVVHIYCQKRSV